MKFWSSPEWEQVKEVLATNPSAVKPDPKYIFRPLIETPLNKVKVMILGSEPSATMEVDGLAYSFPKIVTDTNLLPVALNNIFEEYVHDTENSFPRSGLLRKWAQKGVLLWNGTPTVQKSFPSSHVGIGWHLLTNEIIMECYNRDVVFLLWTPARKMYLEHLLPADAKVIDCSGPGFQDIQNFWGSSPFSKVNAMLKGMKKDPIDWRLP